jgi:TetR/AcrR family transcriptional regulator, fatty acid metabolism regulator protein
MSDKKLSKRLRIVEAAISKFAEKGYHSARMSDIAQKAGVADGTIYNYFQNKEHLLLCIFEEKMTELIESLNSLLTKVDDPIQQIYIFVTHHFEQLQQNPELAQVFQVELRQSQRFFHGYRPKKLFEYLSILHGSILQGQKSGIISTDIDAYVLQWAIFGTLDELSIHWVLSGKQGPLDLKVLPQQVIDIFIRGISVSNKR